MRGRDGRSASRINGLLAGHAVMQVSISALFPILPLYVAHRGGGSLIVAVFIAGPMFASMLVQAPVGRLVDAIGPRWVLIGSRVLHAAISLALFLDPPMLWLLVLLRAGQGVAGGAYLPALRVILAEADTDAERSRRYGRLQAVDTAAFILGPAVGGAVALLRDNAVFLLSCAGVVVGLVPLLRGGIPEPDRSLPVDDEEEPALPGAERPSMRVIARACMPALAVSAISSTVAGMTDVVWPQYMASRDFNTLVIGISAAFFAIPALVLADPASRLAASRHRRLVTSASFALTAVIIVAFPLVYALPLVLLMAAANSAVTSVIEPVEMGAVSELAPFNARGEALGLAGTAEYAGTMAGTVVLGAVYGIDARAPFWAGALILILCASLAQRLPRPTPERTQQWMAALDATLETHHVDTRRLRRRRSRQPVLSRSL